MGAVLFFAKHVGTFMRHGIHQLTDKKVVLSQFLTASYLIGSFMIIIDRSIRQNACVATCSNFMG